MEIRKYTGGSTVYNFYAQGQKRIRHGKSWDRKVSGSGNTSTYNTIFFHGRSVGKFRTRSSASSSLYNYFIKKGTGLVSSRTLHSYGIVYADYRINVDGYLFDEENFKIFLKKFTKNIRRATLGGQSIIVLDIDEAEYPPVQQSGTVRTPEQRAQTTIEKRETYRQQFLNLSRRYICNRAGKLEKDKAIYDNDIRSLRERLIKTIRNSDAIAKEINFIKNVDKEQEVKILTEYDNMMKMEKVKNVTVSNETITVTTDTLTCHHPKTKKMHDIGKFDITINLRTSSIKWNNKTRKVSAYESGMNAPHVFHAGNACMGNVKTMFPELIASFEITAALMLAIQFIESVNLDDSAGSYLARWPIVGESKEAWEKRVANLKRLSKRW